MEKMKKVSNKWISFAAVMLAAGTVYKLYFIEGAFYVQMQEFMGLSHTQIGYIYSIAGWVSTFGFLAAIYVTDRFSKKIMIPFAMIANGIAGIFLATFPPYPVLIVIFCLFAVFSDMLFWPTMLKTIRLLGTKEEQGRMFGFLESGRGLIDTIVNFAALGIFVALGSNLLGFRWSILFFAILSIVIGVFTFFVIEDDEVVEKVKDENKNKEAFNGMIETLKNKDIWLVAVNVFVVYAVYCGIKYFVPFLKDVYGMSIALVSTYGIINSYCLKMVGGPIGGFITDKVTHSATKFIRIMYGVTAIALVAFIFYPHENKNIIIAVIFSLLISTFIFCMRAVFFAPMDEVRVPRRITGSAMSLGSFIGYLPGAFIGIIYGAQLDAHPGVEGYKIVFIIMAVLAVLGILISTILVKRINTISKQEVVEEVA